MFSNDYILLLSGLLWFLPTFTLVNSNLKYFLAVLGCTSLVAFIAQILIVTDPTFLLITGQIVAFYSFQNMNILRRNWKSNISFMISSIILLVLLPDPKFVLPFLSFAVLWKLQKIAVINYLEKEKVNKFYASLVLIQIVIVLYNVLILVDQTYLTTINIIYSICQVSVIIFILLLRKSEEPLIAKLSFSP